MKSGNRGNNINTYVKAFILVSAVLFAFGMVHAADPGPDGYAWRAKEGGSFELDAPHDVAYGPNGKFAYAFNQTGTITFNAGSFGHDPAPGVVKAWYYKRSEPPKDPLKVLRKPVPDKLVVLTFDDGCSTHPIFKEMMRHLKDNQYKVVALRDLAEYIDPAKASKLPSTK